MRRRTAYRGLGVHGAHVGAVEQHLPRSRCSPPIRHSGGGLAAAHGADQRGDAAALALQVHALEHRELAIGGSTPRS